MLISIDPNPFKVDKHFKLRLELDQIYHVIATKSSDAACKYAVTMNPEHHSEGSLSETQVEMILSGAQKYIERHGVPEPVLNNTQS